MKLSSPPKLVEKLVWVLVISFCKFFIGSYTFDGLLGQNWPFSPPNHLSLGITLMYWPCSNIWSGPIQHAFLVLLVHQMSSFFLFVGSKFCIQTGLISLVPWKVWVNPLGWGIAKIRGLGQSDSQSRSWFWNLPCRWASPILKDNAKVIMSLRPL